LKQPWPQETRGSKSGNASPTDGRDISYETFRKVLQRVRKKAHIRAAKREKP